jgi:peptide/nickel transport system substrate-binding protein
MQVHRSRSWIAIGIVLLLTVALGVTSAIAAEPEQSQTGPAVDKVFFKAFHVDRAPLDLAQGNMDLYLFGLKTAAATELRNSDDLQIFEAPATTLSIILNPAPAPEGQLNPFSIRDVRWAMQFLINRDFVAGEIYRGMADPMVTHISRSDFDQLTVFDLIRELNIRYDPEFAHSLIKTAMEGAGAELVDDIWNYNNRPIRLKFIVRIEDERREIGDLVRAELREAGFQVDPVYQNFAPAILTVYSSNPQTFGWHLYTEGWGRSAPDRYDFSSINQFAAPWTGSMPGWREAGFWQYENQELDEVGKRIFTGQFRNLEERNELYRRATQIALEDSVRLWVATVENSFAADRNLVGVTEDLVAGPKSPWTLREASIPGKNELTVGNLWVWTERTTWNPIGGLTDVYSNDIWKNLNDPPLWNHPFSGVPEPMRATFEVDTAGPTDKMSVPSDAFLLDPETDTWKTIGVGTQATSKVTYDYSKYFSAQWHHGMPITMADVMYSIYQNFDMAYDTEKSKVERALAVTARPFLDTFKGFRILDDNRLEVYVDFWHFEENYIASYASPSSVSMPWEVLAAMDDLVFNQRRAAYSDTAAGRFDVPWLSLVMDRDSRLVRTTLMNFIKNSSVPQGVFDVDGTSLVTQSEATERYQSVIDWFSEYGLMVISNGPFMLTRYDPPAQFAELTANRHPDYPFSAGGWSFGSAELVKLAEIPTQPLQIGTENELSIRLEGPGSLGLQYTLFDPAENKVLASGLAESGGSGSGGFTIKLDSTVGNALQPGLYQLFLGAFSDAVSTLTQRRVDLEATIDGPVPVVEPTAVQQAQPTTAPSQQPTEDSGGGCGRGNNIELAYPLGALALLGLVFRRRRY